MPSKRWRNGVLRPAIRPPQRRSRSPVITRSRAVAARIPVTRQPRWFHADSTTDMFSCWAIAPRIDWFIDLKDYATPHPVVGNPLPLVSRVFKHNLLPVWQRVARRWYGANWWRFFSFEIIFNQPGRASLQQRLISIDLAGADTTASEARARRHAAARKKLSTVW